MMDAGKPSAALPPPPAPIPQPTAIPPGGTGVLSNAPGAVAPPPMGGAVQPQFSTADLMNAYAAQLPGKTPAASGDPTGFLASPDGKGFKQVHAEVKQAQLANGLGPTPADPTLQALLAPNELAAVQPLSSTADPIQHGAAAGIMALHSQGQPDGFQGAQAEYAHVDSAFKQGLITDPKLKALYGKFKENPKAMSPDDANTLNQMISTIASATDVIQDPHLKLRVGKVTSIDSTQTGPMVQVQFDPKVPLDPALVSSLSAADTSLPVIKPTTQGLGVYVAPSGTVGVVAAPTTVVATKVRHLYPALTDSDGLARWAPGAPRNVSDGEALRRRLDTLSQGHIGETYDTSALDQIGGHPAGVAGTHIAVDVAGGYQLKRMSQFGTVADMGTVQRSMPGTDDPQDRTVAAAKRVLITLDPADAHLVGSHANEILDTKNGSNVAIYAHDAVDGFDRAREHQFTDGVTTHAHRSADPEIAASHGFDVYVKDASGLPSTSPEGQAVRTSRFTPTPDMALSNDGFGRVIPAGTGEFKTHGANILNSTHGGANVVGFGVFNQGRAPDVVLAYDADTAAQLQQTADVYGTPVGNSVHVQTGTELMPAATVAEAMRVIGVKPSRIVPSGQPAMSGI